MPQHKAEELGGSAKRPKPNRQEGPLHLQPVLDSVARSLASDHTTVRTVQSLACVSKAASHSVGRVWRELSGSAEPWARILVLRRLAQRQMAELRTSDKELCLYADSIGVTALQLGKRIPFSGALVVLDVLEENPLSVTVLCAEVSSVNQKMLEFLDSLRQQGRARLNALIESLRPRAKHQLQGMLAIPDHAPGECQTQLVALVIPKYTRLHMCRLALGERVLECLGLPVVGKLDRLAAKCELVFIAMSIGVDHSEWLAFVNNAAKYGGGDAKAYRMRLFDYSRHWLIHAPFIGIARLPCWCQWLASVPQYRVLCPLVEHASCQDLTAIAAWFKAQRDAVNCLEA